MALLITAVDAFAKLIIYLLLARAIGSWFIRPGNSLFRIYQGLVMITEPVVAPCRRITARLNTGMLDLSVFLAFFLVMIVRDLLIRLLIMIG